MRLESTFVFYCSVGIDFYMHMMKAKNDTVKILAGFSPITYKEFSFYQKIKLILEKARVRCNSLKGYTDLPYNDAGKYIDCMITECSMVIKLHLSKAVSHTDIISHIDAREMVVPEAFNKLFLTDFAPEDRKDVLDFERKYDDRTTMLYSMLLMAFELGL